MGRQFNRRLPANTWEDIAIAKRINVGSTDTQLAIEAFALLRKHYEEQERRRIQNSATLAENILYP